MDVVEQFFPKSPPFNGKPRENQGEVIQQIYDAIVGGKRFVVIAAPTGAGKSVILYSLARAINMLDPIDHNFDGDKSIFTTSQKLLQDQYENDFHDMFVMKGRNNYPCERPVELREDEDRGYCDAGECLFKKEHPICWDRCPYRMAKQRAIASPLVITNLAYFIHESNSANAFGKRRLLVVDEAHTIENGLMSYIESPISQMVLKFCDIKMKVPMYDHFSDYEPFLKELKDAALDKAEKIKREMELDPFMVFTKEQRQYDRLTGMANKITFMFFHRDTCKWIADPNEEKERVVFKPVNVSPFGNSLVFGYADTVLLSSATISRTYVRTCLGIDDFEYLEVPSTFPVENRPIYAMNAGKMSYMHLDNTLPKIVKKVDEILEQFPDSKGIIHATSYKIAKYIQDNSEHWQRLISHNSKNRMERLEEHITSPEPTVLLSPSMTEGVDLKGDLSKFQIIVKLPYASLGDKQIKARMEDDKVWYASLVATQMMQAYGRSIRSKTDVAMTFVLDSAFRWFLKSNEGLFCEWFKEAVR